jgi:hypothetical protein
MVQSGKNFGIVLKEHHFEKKDGYENSGTGVKEITHGV